MPGALASPRFGPFLLAPIIRLLPSCTNSVRARRLPRRDRTSRAAFEVPRSLKTMSRYESSMFPAVVEGSRQGDGEFAAVSCAEPARVEVSHDGLPRTTAAAPTTHQLH